jgi:hypothetical protein
MDNRIEPPKPGGGRMAHEDGKNYLKNAELDLESAEAGYDMIDGIINNVPNANVMREYGYTWDGMAQIDKHGALAIFNMGFGIYLLHEDGTESVAESREAIESFDGLFGFEKERSSVIRQLAEARQRDTGASPERVIHKTAIGDQEQER